MSIIYRIQGRWRCGKVVGHRNVVHCKKHRGWHHKAWRGCDR